MLNVLGESTPSYTRVKNWIADFKHGCTCINDKSRSVRPLLKCKPRYTMEVNTFYNAYIDQKFCTR